MTLAEQYGEEPARFLARPLPDCLELIKARIRGIDTVTECQEWVRCEAAIGPRKEVIATLNQRKSQLQVDETLAADGGEADE